MKVIEMKLDKITDVWNKFILRERFFQEKINFNEEVKTNYFGDIIYYFYDTLLIIERNTIPSTVPKSKPEEGEEFSTSMFYAIGLLQIIFIQHDLMREFFHIFNLERDERKQFEKEIKTVRNLRNELIGHPINRNSKTGELRSTVFWGNFTSRSEIHFLKYIKKDNFREGLEKRFSILEILNRHETVLKKFLNIILNNMKGHLEDYLEILKGIELLAVKDENFPIMVERVEENCQQVTGRHLLLKKESILYCYNKREEHYRYRYALDLYRNELSYKLVHLKNDIYAYLGEEDKIVENKMSTEIGICSYENISHCLLGLVEKKQIITEGESLKRRFSDSPEIIREFGHMEENIENDAEYYTSYFYIKNKLLKDGEVILRP